MEAMTKDLWVFVETNEDGSAEDTGIELLTPGRHMATTQGGELVAVILGYHTGKAVSEASSYGADKIIVIDDEALRHYDETVYEKALNGLVEKYGPASVLMAATDHGRELGSHLSCKLSTVLPGMFRKSDPVDFKAIIIREELN